MTIQSLIDNLSLTVLTRKLSLDQPFHDVYVSDLLSAALAKLTEKHVWVTIQVHLNILGVASIKEVVAVILGENMKPDDDVIAKAEEKQILLVSSPYSAFEISGLLYNLLKEEKSGS